MSRSRFLPMFAGGCLLLLVLSMLLGTAPMPTTMPAGTPEPVRPSVAQSQAFAQQVDLTPFNAIAVHTEGRLKSYESFVRGLMKDISGSRLVNNQPHTFTYLDMMLRPDAYSTVPTIFVKKKPMRQQLADALLNSADAAKEPRLGEKMDQFVDTGLIEARLLMDYPAAIAQISVWRQNLITTAKYAEMIEGALSLSHPSVLPQLFKVIPPPDGGFDEAFDDPWMTMNDLTHAAHSQQGRQVVPNQSAITAAWLDFTAGWQAQDAPRVNAAAARLAELLPQVNEEIYPSQSRLNWESWYFRSYNMTWVWMFYLLATIPLLLATVFRWPAARWLGLLLFFGSFGLHTFAVMLRWYVSGRWPNSNMFEAVTTAAWFGGCLAVLMEVFLGRTPMRNLFALTSAVGSMVALMAAYFLPLSLNPNIGNMMPVLHDIWLYIHTNVIIFSYCLIAMAGVSAILYLIYRLAGALGDFSGTDDYARVGGAASLIVTAPDGSTYLTRAKTTLGQVLDGVTMVLMELSFILLWAGIVMGAIWADHSWGRPWGWDPKEVFALNTFIVFIILIHARLKVKDKGLWTAAIALFGCVVMLFNWIAVNFYIVGLHSYA